MVIKEYQTSSSGFSSMILILLVVVFGSILLAGGISPQLNESKENTTGQTKEVDLSPELSPNPSGTKNSLQLRTLKFKECTGEMSIDLLLDRSNSMSSLTPSRQTKIDRLKEAVLALISKMTDSSVIGIQSFSSDSITYADNITNDVPISFYRDVNSIIAPKVNALSPGGNTPTHDALDFSLNKLREALPKFSGRKFNFILISDGQPVPDSQDPRLFNPNPADEIKNLGVTIYTLGIYDSKQARNPGLANLLKSIASKPENYFEAQTGDETPKLLEAITAKICSKAN